jgi:hypothetical protein
VPVNEMAAHLALMYILSLILYRISFHKKTDKGNHGWLNIMEKREIKAAFYTLPKECR